MSAERPNFIPDSLPSPEKSARPALAFGHYQPKFALTNKKIEHWEKVRTASGVLLKAKDIEDRVGTEVRYVAGRRETPLSMGLESAQQAYNKKPGKIDAVVVMTNFPTKTKDHPNGINLSTEIAKEFGVTGFNTDVSAGCSALGYTLDFIKQHERKFNGRRVLFVSTEKIFPYLQDLRTNTRRDGTLKDPALQQTIFTDGSTALIVDYGKGLKILFSSVHTFPDRDNDAIKMPIDRSLLAGPHLIFPAPFAESGVIEQDGKRVYELMRNAIPKLVREEVQKAGFKPSDFKNLDPHQGSGHIVDVLAKLLPEYLVSKNYQRGNPSSGAILEILRKAHQNREIAVGDKRLLAVFGAGLLAVIGGLEFGR